MNKKNTPTMKIRKKLEEYLKSKDLLYLINNDKYVNYQEKENKKLSVTKKYNNFFEILDIPLFKNIIYYLILQKFQENLILICKLNVIIYIF